MSAVLLFKIVSAVLLFATHNKIQMPALHERPPLIEGDALKLADKLWKAAEAGDIKEVKDARAKGASIAWRNPYGPPGRNFQFSALHCAVLAQRVDLVKFLLAEGADINARFEPYGDSPFELAASTSSKGGMEVYELLKAIYEKQLEQKRQEMKRKEAEARKAQS